MSFTLPGLVSGPVFSPDDDGYVEEIAPWNRATAHTPEVVVGAESPEDVAAAVRYAAAAGLRVSVQSTGHGAEAPVTTGLMISTRRLNRLSIDPASRLATLGAGVQWGAVVAAAAEFGLAPVTGSAPTVGVVGLLVGGGLGPLARSHGFASDHVEGFTVVTGAGEIVTADQTGPLDLFWALRGGKYGLGIVTEVRVRLAELPSLYGGALYFGEGDIEAGLRNWVDYTVTADPRVTTSAAIMRYPAIEAVPGPLRGRTLLTVRFAYPGSPGEGAALAGPLRSGPPVYLDALDEMPAAEIAKIHNDPTRPGPSRVCAMLLTGIDQEFASAFLSFAGPAGGDTPFVGAELRHLGGATHHDVEGGSAVAGRGAQFTCGFAGNRPDLLERAMPEAVGRWATTVRDWISPERNANFMGVPGVSDRLAEAWPEKTAARLAEIRLRYDPEAVLADPLERLQD